MSDSTTHHYEKSHHPASKCDLCGMVAITMQIDQFGVRHHYCEHHRPASGGQFSNPKSQLPNNDQFSNKSKKTKASNFQNAQHDLHDRHAGHSPNPPSPNGHGLHGANMFRDRFWISLAVTIPTVLYSTMFQDLIRWSPPSFPGSESIPFLGGTFLLIYGGSVFLKSALTELQAKLPGMMTLISLAILAAYGWSVVATFFTVGGDFFWELATLITVMLLGHWIEMRSVSSAQGALHELAKFLPDMAERERTDGTTETVAIAQIVVGDVLIIRPGTKIPVDGEVIEGTSSLNEAMITGESNPIEKTVGSSMIAGTVNGHGVLKIRTTKIGADTALSGIMRLVAEAQASRSRAQVIADQAAFALTVAALMVGIGSLVVWLAVGQTPTFAFERLVTVLVIACPHALGLAVPLVTAISTTLAAKNGILIRKRITLEAARSLDVILFDKTGTLTSGEFGVRAYAAIPGRKSDDIFTVAAAVESASEHPLAQAMATKAKELKLALPKVRAIEAIPGQGVTGKIGGRTITVGGPQFLRARRLTIPTTLQSLTNQAGEQGQTIVYVLDGKEIIGAITLADQIRPESRAAIRVLHDLGLKIAMVTGDSQAVADAVAKELKIDTVFAQVLPEEKVKNVKELQIGGQRVAMVGDGVNDAAALTQADVGIAIGAGTDVAIESAGIVLMRNDPRDIVKILTLARATYAKTVQNLFWATGYNVVAIPLAAGVLVAQGILLAPALGAILMSLSTVIVATNAQLLRRLNLTMEQG